VASCGGVRCLLKKLVTKFKVMHFGNFDLYLTTHASAKIGIIGTRNFLIVTKFHHFVGGGGGDKCLPKTKKKKKKKNTKN
jgi:hypothetical protein